MDKLPKHLGGGERRCHEDKGAVDWAVKKFDVKSMLDVGCGQGCVSYYAQKKGVEVLGIDGDPGNLHGEYNFKRPSDYPFMLHDYTTGPAPVDKEVDLVWSVEFLEHVEEEYMPNFMDTFRKGKVLIVTHALPHAGTVNHRSMTNHLHVNEREPGYWLEKFDEYGFDYQKDLSMELRKASSMMKNFVRNTGMVFFRR